MTIVEVNCDFCGSLFSRPLKEVNRCRTLGRGMYCKLDCFNAVKSLRAMPKERGAKCVLCGGGFTSRLFHGEWTEYCTRSCASLGSVTPLRRAEAKRLGYENIGNLNTDVSYMMKIREAWKYKDILLALDAEPHEFEYPLMGYVFDLALFERKLLVEFDAINHHIDSAQIAIDERKDLVAKENGFDILRIEVEASQVIPASVLSEIDLRTSTVGGSMFGLGSRMPTPPPIQP